jgi:hypothetical protein
MAEEPERISPKRIGNRLISPYPSGVLVAPPLDQHVEDPALAIDRHRYMVRPAIFTNISSKC